MRTTIESNLCGDGQPFIPYFPYRLLRFDFQLQEASSIKLHIDAQYVAYGRLPLPTKKRDHFAIEARSSAAALDNIQIMGAKPHPRQKQNLQRLLKHPRQP